ncbi:Uncharacterised protein [Legionella beliardensis]|uniref:Uncharacterized protein n=1 Tax=Legionella beliardensis TaxID=91822 RepID=A0A378I3S3_9GAMM|nr:hypothetical protein [Legionella beliardensis]STX29365.1 Uncharacterised protein [Legionella beliardensis]
MPIINGNHLQKKNKLNIQLNSEIFDKINAYCAWANITNISLFIEEAANLVFAKDRDWKQHSKALKKKQVHAG